MKPTKTFKLSKRNKTMTALFAFKDHDTRCAFRAMMVQAQLLGEQKLKAEPRRSHTATAQVA